MLLFLGEGRCRKKGPKVSELRLISCSFAFFKHCVNTSMLTSLVVSCSELVFSVDKKRVNTRTTRQTLRVSGGNNTRVFFHRIFIYLHSYRENMPVKVWRSWPSSWRCWKKISEPATTTAPPRPLCPSPIHPSHLTGLQRERRA